MRPLFLLGTVAVGATAITGISVLAGSKSENTTFENSEEISNNNKGSSLEEMVVGNNEEAKRKCSEIQGSTWIVGKDGRGTCTSTKQEAWPIGIIPPPPPPPYTIEDEDDKTV